MKGFEDDGEDGNGNPLPGIKRRNSLKAEVESLAPTVLFRNMPAVHVHPPTVARGGKFVAPASRISEVAPRAAATDGVLTV
ncbi:hypothetical protein HDU93_009803 [Gonapodya sp. JEL0774]|nr:hypothetical protein HDU93_009803 [Gonapodya sp. JEL0774]